MADWNSLLRLTAAGHGWLWAAAALLLGALVVTTCRRLLSGFSRKRLLNQVDEAERERFEEFIHRADHYESALRAIDQSLRLALVACFAFAAIHRGEQGVGWLEEVLSFVVFVVGVLLVFLFGLELLPSILARVRTEWSLRRLLPSLDRLYQVLLPMGRCYRSIVSIGARAVGGEAERTAAAMAEDEILSAVDEGEREGILEEEDISMIESIIRFRDREVSEVMTPRTEMVCLKLDDKIEKSVQAAIDCGHSRIPVYQENRDNIAGFLYVKDLLRFWEQRGDREVKLADLLRQAHFVPESKKISELFHEFRSQRFHIAIILDEFGGTAGLITIEDIIEEIVGEIVDEFDKVERPDFQQLEGDVVEVNARMAIHELNEKLEAAIPEKNGYDTLGGFLFSSLGKIPLVGDSYQHGRLHFKVIEADDRKVTRVRVWLQRSKEAREVQGGE